MVNAFVWYQEDPGPNQKDSELFPHVCLQYMHTYNQRSTKEGIGIEQQLYEIVRGKNFALNCLSWKFREMIMITNEVVPENLVVVR